MAEDKKLLEEFNLADFEITKLSEFKPPEEIIMTMYLTKENDPGTSKMSGRWSKGLRDLGAPNHKSAQKGKILATTTKPDSRSEFGIPGLWPSWVNKEYCCIYIVPNRLRRVNPEAYTPQILLIVPLQYSKKVQALEQSKTNLRYLDYINKELQKVKYLNGVANLYGDQTVQAFRGIIQRDEKIIRESYAEYPDWIRSQGFWK